MSLRLLLLLALVSRFLASCAPEPALRPGEVLVASVDLPGRVRLEDGRVLALYGLSTPEESWGRLEEIPPALVRGKWRAKSVTVRSAGEEDCERWLLERDGEWLSARMVRGGAALAADQVSGGVLRDGERTKRLALATQSAQRSRLGPWRAVDADARIVPRAMGSVALPLHSKDPSYDYSRELNEIAELGAGWVSLLVVTRQERVDSSTVPLTSAWTPETERIVATIESAKALGLRVLLMPLVLIEHMGPDDWRGTLAPEDPDSWWQSYLAYMQGMADLARLGDADALCVGSEFASLETEHARWRRVIAGMRLRFGGLLTYSANWDHFDEIQFWPHLDFAGMTAYFELSEAEEPSPEELRAGWRTALSEVVRLKESSDLPVFLTEVGIPSARGAAGWPWDYTREAPVDLELQRDAFEAFHAVFHPAGAAPFPGFLGQCFYDWWGLGGPEDAGYTARKKPAAEIWRQALSDTR